MIMCYKRVFCCSKTERKEHAVKLSPSLLMEHARRSILRDGVQQIVAYGNTGDTWIVDMTAGHLTTQKLQQLRAIATVDMQDMDGITRLMLAF